MLWITTSPFYESIQIELNFDVVDLMLQICVWIEAIELDPKGYNYEFTNDYLNHVKIHYNNNTIGGTQCKL
jgi:hypothetical protein